MEQFRTANKNWVQVWNTVEVDAMIADNSSGFGRMSGLVADKAGWILPILIDVFVLNSGFSGAGSARNWNTNTHNNNNSSYFYNYDHSHSHNHNHDHNNYL